MKRIKLTQGKYALVDNEDFEWLNQWKWHMSSHGYVMRRPPQSRIVYMHRLINGTPDDSDTDHINRNKLDNRRENLRIANKILNGRNRGENKNNTSGHKGISWDKRVRKWAVYLWNNYRKIHLGYCDELKEADKVRMHERRNTGYDKKQIKCLHT